MDSHIGYGRIKKGLVAFLLILTMVTAVVFSVTNVYADITSSNYWNLTVGGRHYVYVAREDAVEFINKYLKEEIVDKNDKTIVDVEIQPELKVEEVTSMQFDGSVEVIDSYEELAKQMLEDEEVKVVVKKRYTVENPIPFNTVIEYDQEKYEDEEDKIKTVGKKGTAEVLKETIEINGELIKVTDISSKEIVPAVNKIIVRGTKERPELLFEDGVLTYTGEGSYFSWPYSGLITSYFGYRWDVPGSTDHQGIDINASYGAPVYAARAGVVSSDTGWVGAYGYLVKIDHGDGMESLYAHNSSLAVSPGEYVEEGQLIAYAGSTGWSTGTHVHFEVRYEGTPVNPLNFLP